MIDDYTLLKCIGKGAFGEVYLTSKKGTNKLFATKKVSKEKVNAPQIKKNFVNEISILKVVQHKNIVKLETIRQSLHNYYIITEYYNGGGLYDCLKKYRMIYGRAFSEEIVQHLARQIIDALKYLHMRKIIHRDLKLENLLINFESEEDKNNLNMIKAEVKIIDFGFSTYLDGGGLRYSILGSPINMDPILLKKLLNQNISNLIGYDEKADIWSLGTVCYELNVGEMPFKAQNMIELITKVEKGIYHIPTKSSQEFASFLNCMLRYNSKSRLSAEELSRHPFITKNIIEFSQIDLSKFADRIDEKGIIFDIRKNQDQQSYYQNQNYSNNVLPNTYNYFGNTNIGPKYYMADIKPQNRKVLYTQPIQTQDLGLNNNLQRQYIYKQPLVYNDKNIVLKNKIPVEQNRVQNIQMNFGNQKITFNNSNNYSKKGNNSISLYNTNNEYVENIYNGKLKKLSKAGSFNTISPNETNLEYQYNQNIPNTLTTENNNQIQKNRKYNFTRQLSSKITNNFYRDQFSKDKTNKISYSPDHYSHYSGLSLNNNMMTIPVSFLGANNENNFIQNQFSETKKLNNGNYNTLNEYKENELQNYEAKEEVSSKELDDLFDMNIGNELPPEPEVMINQK